MCIMKYVQVHLPIFLVEEPGVSSEGTQGISHPLVSQNTNIKGGDGKELSHKRLIP